MVSWEDAKAVFVAVDEYETGWMAQADVGGALQRYVHTVNSEQPPAPRLIIPPRPG
jgi:hypothetical protein